MKTENVSDFPFSVSGIQSQGFKVQLKHILSSLSDKDSPTL